MGYGYGKRSADAEPEADAEADPALHYGSYGYPYAGVYGGYRAYGAYPATYGYGYRTYGAYPYSYYGKRSADAEADPPLPYNNIGLPYPYGGYGASSPTPRPTNYLPLASVAFGSTYTDSLQLQLVQAVLKQ